MDSNMGILFATVVLVAVTTYYAWQTRQMVLRMDRDLENRTRPYLTAAVIPWIGKLVKLRVQNTGGGAAFNVDVSISAVVDGQKIEVPWKHGALQLAAYEEFGVPHPPEASQVSFNIDWLREHVSDVRVQGNYQASTGKVYTINQPLHLREVTDSWIESRMLVTADHPDRLGPRIAKTLEDIRDALKR